MTTPRMIKTFTDRYPLVGPAIWILSIQYFIIQIVTALDYTTRYSWAHNTISDLGNTMCGLFNGRPVCSSLHGLMNASFILLGATMIVGASLIYQEFRENAGSFIGFSGMALAGLGSVLVGFFPENTVAALHTTGAGLVFLVGNISMVILSLSLNLPKSLRIYTFLSGAISLLALGFFIVGQYLGLGIGGLERVVAYPQTIWLIVFGIYISSNHLQKSISRVPKA